MKYQDAINYIEKCAAYGIVPGLETIRELLSRLGNPQNDLKVIHIAGTNGKGSVLAFLSTILKENGYKVGSYISPAVFDYREKFQIQQKSVSKAEVVRLVEEVGVHADQMETEGRNHPTPFEIETAMAFLLFHRKKCDFVVLETGMGGRLDATNVIETSLLSIFTPIGMDHMGYLGNTLEEIAFQKAGIIKNGSRVISANQESIVKTILSEEAKKREASLPVFVDLSELKQVSYGLEKQKFAYKDLKKAAITMAGLWQVENACLALEAVTALKEIGYRFTEEKIRKGLFHTQWKGRFQIISKKPYFIVDGAHNHPSALQLKKTIEFYFTNKKIIYIIGMFRDKDYELVLQETCPLASHIITITLPDHKRSLSALELAHAVQKYNKTVTVADSVEEALELSGLLAQKEDVILAFGSLSYLGKCMETIDKKVSKK